MFFRCLNVLFVVSLPVLAGSPRELRVCADPNNLPFSNHAGQGLENRLAEVLAADLNAELKYTWWTERKSFLQQSLQAGLCDVVMGVPSTLDSVLTTKPYYHSTYAFVERRDRHSHVLSLNDSALEHLKIGIHVVGDDYAPPAHLLARRGLASQIVGYSLYGKFGEPNPPSLLLAAVARGDVDIAIVWGPFAGYFAPLQSVPLKITPVSPPSFLTVPFTYGISVAVRKGDSALLSNIQRVLTKECKRLNALLVLYGIPQAGEDTAECGSSQSVVF
jgi:mxaJ protein